MNARFILFILTALMLMQPVRGFASGTNNAPARAGLPGELKSFLTNADEFVLFSLNPVPDFEHKSTNTFQNHVILGQIAIKRATTKASLISALDKGIEEETVSNGGLPAPLPDCFNPRHGIRATKGDEIVEFLICLECAQIQVGSNKGKSWFFTTSKSPAATFNGVLRRNGVRLSKD